MAPFRSKSSTVEDHLRDKIRDELRSFFTYLKSSLRTKGGMSSTGQDLLDRLTFILSVENGFMMNDFYSSTQLDQFITTPNIESALYKLTGLLTHRPNDTELSSNEAKRRLNFFC